jgi:putative N6-adenine-specific DNA methylase
VPPGGWIITNPPYGARVGERGPLRALYARLGDIVAGLDGWSLALLSADRVLEGQLKLPLTDRWASTNGGIAIRLVVHEA